ncbi:MAG: hypothetical protein IAI50_05545, partial [Candidatus Eremiobacteraeota bacterium]|nr:hypothetical protein [Candidatus Eremiobacteraeota bacterium]
HANSLENTPLTTKYASLVTVATPTGASLQSYLGAAIGTASALPNGGLQQRYERGVIIARKTGGVSVVYGDIYAQWYRLGGSSGFLGLPLSDQAAAGAGFVQTFDGGDICWSAATGARSIHGAIRDRWHALGGATSVLGFPTSDENAIVSNGAEIGRFNTFVNGAGIYWSGPTGAWDVYGGIAACWQSYGGPSGTLGLPISGETNTPDAGGRYNEFSGGIVVWHPSGPYNGAFALFDLEFYLDHFESDFSSIHVGVNIDAHHPDLSNHTWFPSDSDYASNPNVQQTLVRVPVVNSGTTLDVWMDGLGDHTFGKDERLGIFSMHYDITNLWGIFENATHPANTNIDSDHHFNCIFSCRTQLPLNPDLPFRAQYFWPFENFDTDPMSDTTFAQTFADVHEDESALWHPFDQLFYELVYKTIGKHGNCFGMCLEALYAIAGRSVVNEPIYNNPAAQYGPLAQGATPDPSKTPSDYRFTGPINIKHGYQVGDSIVFYFLGEYIAGNTHDPVRAFQHSRAAFQAGDRPIMSLTEGSGFGSGHAVLPYAWDNSKSPWTISIANPNAPYSKTPDDAAPPCRILVDPAANTFSLVIGYNDDGSPDTWSGSSSGGGRMFHVPFSKMNSEPSTPIDDILALISSTAYIILGGDGQTTEITDQHGRTLNATTPGSRIPNMAAVPIVSGDPLLAGQSVNELKTVNDVALVQSVRLAAPAFPETYVLCRPPSFEPVGTASIVARPSDKVQVGEQRVAPSEARPTGQTPTAEQHVIPSVVARPIGESWTSERPPATPNVAKPTAETSIGDRLVSDIELAGEDAILTWEIASTGTAPYVWGLRSPAGSIVATVPANANGATDVLRVQNVARSLPAITLQAANGMTKTASVTLVGPALEGSAQARIYEVSGIPMMGGTGITLQLNDGGESLQIVNPAGDAAINVRMQAGSNAANAIARSVVATGGNAAITVAPASWTAPSIAAAAVTVKQYDRAGGTVLKQMQL